MKNILLITPQRNLRRPGYQYLSMPMGLAQIASMLQIQGYVVEILDTPIEGYNNWERQPNGVYKCGLSNDEVKKRVLEFKPDVIGISNHFTARSGNVASMARAIKEVTKVPIVVGGMHATVCTEQVLQESAIDFVILGEAEVPFLNLINKIKNNETDFDKLQAIAFKRDGQTFISSERVLIDNLNSLPLPAYEILPMDKYFRINPGRDGMTSERRYASIITSRGCPHLCTFCSSKNIWSNKWRFRDPNNILAEIELLTRAHDIKEISFEDDNLTLDTARIDFLCREIIHRNLRFKWNTPNGVSVLHLNRNTIQLMKSSGCTRLNFGIESGDPHVLNDIMNKNVPLDKIKEVVNIAHEEGLVTTGYFVIGMPGETVESMQRSLNFAKSLPLDEIGLNIAVPYPMTAVEKTAKEQGYLKIDASQIEAEDDIGQMVFMETPLLSAKDLLDFKKYFFMDFYKDRIKRNPLHYAKRAIKDPRLIRRFIWKKS
jgi:anaerobic magnesium-protoporphyrin IX monomethyl ester cyclase